jgi:hypothetical protein
MRTSTVTPLSMGAVPVYVRHSHPDHHVGLDAIIHLGGGAQFPPPATKKAQ